MRPAFAAARRTAPRTAIRTYAAPAGADTKPPVALFGLDGTYANALVRILDIPGMTEREFGVGTSHGGGGDGAHEDQPGPLETTLPTLNLLKKRTGKPPRER